MKIKDQIVKLTQRKIKQLKQNFKEYKRRTLKGIQSNLRQFLNTEYRTKEEIDNDNINLAISYLNSQKIRSCTELSGLDGRVGVIDYIECNDTSYYKNHKTGNWINALNGEELTEQELKELYFLKMI